MKLKLNRIFALIVVGVLIITSYGLMIDLAPREIVQVPSENVPDSDSLLNEHRTTRAGTPWPMHLNNPAHISHTTDKGPITNELLWSNITGGITYSSPAVVNNKVYIGGDNSMCAFWADNGTLVWQTPTYQPVPGSEGFSSSPAVENGYVFYGGDGIYCLYENNGTIKWFVDTPPWNWGDGTPTVANNKVFIAGSDWNLYCIDQETGSILWTFQTSSSGENNWGLYAAPAVVNGFVYLSACDGYLYQINETQPSKVATAYNSYFMGYASYSSPVVVNDRVYVGTGYEDMLITVNRFFCLSASDLSLIWDFYPGSATSFFSSGGYYDGRIYIGSRDGNLYCLDAMDSNPTPTVFWQYYIGETWSSPAITNERLYIGTKSGYLYCFNLTQPPPMTYYWRALTGGGVDTSPAVSNGRVYIGSHANGGTVLCFGNASYPPEPPEPPTDLQAQLVIGGLDVMLSWVASSDDGGGDNDVAGYTVYKSSNGVNGVYKFAAWIEADGSPSYSWTHIGYGDGEPNDYFYIVRANHTLDIEEQNTNKVGKVVYSLAEGWNLMSVPLEQGDTSREIVLQTLGTDYISVQGYHAGKSRPWLHWHRDKPNDFNDVIEINHNEAYYVDMLATDDLVVVGRVPSSTLISLKAGWNLIGYPSLESKTRDSALASILGLYNAVEFYNTTAGKVNALGPDDYMEPGYGYWIHVIEDCELII